MTPAGSGTSDTEAPIEPAGPPYPYNIFPTDLSRRVIAHLPDYLTKKQRDANNASRAELWEDEPVPAPEHPHGFTFEQLVEKLTEDEFSVVDDMTGRRNYTEGEINEALEWHITKGYVARSGDLYQMTAAGRNALTL